MRARGWLLSAVFVSACAPAPRAVSVTSCPSPAEPSAPWAPCVIRGSGDYSFFSEYPLYLTPESKDAIAVVHHPSAVGASWSELPEPSKTDGARARIEIEPQHGLRFSGYATLAGRGFHVIHRVDLRPGHAWVRAGSPVEVRGARDGRIVVVGYDERFEVTTTCENVAFVPSLPREKDDVERSGGRPIYTALPILHLAANANGCALVALPAAWTGDLQSLESRDGWAHVRGGGASFVLDGWSPLAELTNVVPARDRDFGDPLDDMDRCGPTAAAKFDADVSLAPDGPRIATLEKETLVDLLSTKGDFSAIALHSRNIVAPDAKQFWVRSSVLEPRPGVDGCPD
jgi:hypothetical protein